MAEDRAVCLVQTQEFEEYAERFLNLSISNEESFNQDLDYLLDGLNSLDYNFDLTETEAAERVLCQGTHLIDQTKELPVIKFCKLVVNIISKQKISPDATCLTTLLEYFIGVLRTCQSNCFSQVLTAVGALIYEPKNKFEDYWDCLAGPDGILINITKSKDPENKRAALKCLENFTYRSPGDPYIGEACVEACFKVFLETLQAYDASDDSSQCRILISVLRGLQNLITNSKNVHLNNLGIILASLKDLTFHGLPGFSSQSSLNASPTILSQSPVDSSEDLRTNDAKNKQSKGDHQQKKNRRKSNGRKPDSMAWRTQSESQLTSNQDADAYVDPLSSIWTPNLFSPSEISVNSSSWTKISSSESEYSDGEGGVHLRRIRIFQAKVRTCAHSALHSVVKNTDKKVIFGYITFFLPDSPSLVGVPQTHSLLTSILKDPSPKVRTSALLVLTAFLDGSKQYLASADDSERYHMAFTPFSMTLALMIKELHRCLLLALVAEISSLTLTQLIKCLSTFILNVPFHKLASGLLTKMVRHLRQFLNHRDSNVRVACLTCFGSMLSLQPPMSEVAQILMDESSPTGYSLSMSDESIMYPSSESIRHKESSPTDLKFSSIEMHQAFSSMLKSLSNARKEPWLVQVCQENIYALNLGAMENEGLVKNTPLPVRLESLQVLATLAKGYFFILRSNLNQLAGLIHSCLLDQESSVVLHGARLFEQLGQAMLNDLNLNGNSCNPLYPTDYVPISVEETVSVWLHLLDGPLPSALQNATLPPLRATGCDCLANIGSRPFELLPTDYRSLCLSLLLSLIGDEDNSVKAEAVRALGVYVLFPSLREDIDFLADAANAIITAMEDINVSVRIKACWALGNLSDAFVLNRTEGNDLFVEELSDRLLYKLCITAINAAQDNDKVKSNAVRAIGNLLRFMGDKTVCKGNFLAVIHQSVEMLIKNVTTGNNMKVRWNACYAIGNLFHNLAIPFNKSDWLMHVMKGLTYAIKSCKNFKVRINAAIAFMVPMLRYFYGSSEEFVSLFEDLLIGLEMAQQIDSFTEYKYQDNLIDQLCFALCHLMSLIEEKDFEYLHAILAPHIEQLEISMKKFREKMTSDKEEILSKVVTNFEESKDDIQKQHILQLFSVPNKF